MSRPPPQTPDQAFERAVDPARPLEEAAQATGMSRTPKGWVVYGVWVTGQRVVKHEVLAGPMSRAAAMEAYKLDAVRRFMMGVK